MGNGEGPELRNKQTPRRYHARCLLPVNLDGSVWGRDSGAPSWTCCWGLTHPLPRPGLPGSLKVLLAARGAKIRKPSEKQQKAFITKGRGPREGPRSWPGRPQRLMHWRVSGTLGACGS